VEPSEGSTSAALLAALRATTHAINTNELARSVLGARGNALTNTLLNAMARKGLIKNIAKPRTLGWWIAVREEVMTTILFPSNPIQPKSVDGSFGYEARAAKEAGYKIGRIDLEVILGGEIKLSGVDDGAVIYRGWLMKPEQYREMHEKLAGRLVVSPDEYLTAYYLPRWYRALASVGVHQYTPKSIWLEPGADLTDLDRIAGRVAEAFDGPVIVKDYVKSAKHRWFDACYIGDAQNDIEVKRVVKNFLDTVSDGLVGSLVFRDFVNFKRIGTHSKINLPLINEHRAFMHLGKVFYTAPYWAEGDYSGARPSNKLIETLAAGLHDQPLIAVDVAEKIDSDWMIVEVNPGGAAGVPEGGSVKDFYLALSQVHLVKGVP